MNSRAVSNAWVVLVGLVLTGYVCDGPSAQQRRLGVRTDEDVSEGQALVFGDFVPSTRTLARGLLDNFEVVAVGVFDDPPDLESDLLDVLKPHDLTVSFRILMPYKAPPAQGAVVDVLVNSDMLAVPGGDVSRYAARFSEGQRLATEIDSITAQLLVLDQRRETGDLTVAEYENESTKLNGARDRLITQSGAIPTRMWVQSHGDNFYTLGGAIRPGVKYLVGLKSSPGDPQTYLLDELPTSTRDIYWGEMAEDIVAALNDLVP